MISRIGRPIGTRLLLGAMCFSLLAGVVYAETGVRFEMSYVAVTGHLKEAQRAEVYQRLMAEKDSIDGIDDIKKVLEQVSWIRQVNVTRRWPDGVTVRVFEEKPIAWWNGDSYLDDTGNVFKSPWLSATGLARLYGPKGAERAVMEQYQQLARALGRTGRSINTLVLDARGAWEFTTADGIRVMLGKDDIMDRFQRFLRVLDSAQLRARAGNIRRIDTRYGNGVAVSWKEAPAGLSVAKTDNY
jgi:cell division protein FtsQ